MDLSNTAEFIGRTVSAQAAQLERKRVYQYAALAAVTILAVLLRFYKLGEWGFWIDEVYEINYAIEFLRDPYFPVRLSLPLTAIGLTWLGTNEFTARFMPMLVGIISLPILYFPIKKLLGTSVALLAVLLIAISPWHLFWSQNVRFYTTLMLFYGLGQFFFFFWLENDRLIDLFLSGVFLFLALLERSVAVYIGPVVVGYLGMVWLFSLGRPQALRWRNLLLLGGLGLLGGLFLLLVTGSVSGFAEHILGHRHNPMRVLLSVISDLGLPLFVLGLAAGLFLVIKKSRSGVFILAGALVPLIILLLIAPFTQAFSRYVLLTLPNWAILGAVAVKELMAQSQKHAKLFAVAILLLLVADAFSQNVLYFGYQNGNREDFRSAYLQIKRDKTEGDLVIAGWPELGEYYLGEDVIENHTLKGKDILESGKKAWVIVDNRSGFSPSLQKWVEANGELVGVYDVYLSGKLLMVRLYRYDPSVSSIAYPPD